MTNAELIARLSTREALADRKVLKIVARSKTARCLTCGNESAPLVNSHDVYYAPVHKGGCGVVVPRGQFAEHNRKDGTICPASGMEAGQANARAFGVKEED